MPINRIAMRYGRGRAGGDPGPDHRRARMGVDGLGGESSGIALGYYSALTILLRHFFAMTAGEHRVVN